MFLGWLNRKLKRLGQKRQKRSAERQFRKNADEKKKIAKAFNDRYTYRFVWKENMPFLGGSYYGIPHRSGYAWMCPTCNHIYHPVSDSVFSGLQYPACCEYPAGDRLYLDIKTKK